MAKSRRYRGGRQRKKYAWWMLQPSQKAGIQDKRLGGEYGGETAAGVERAPYFWSQEYGNPRADIAAQGFAEESWEQHVAKSEEIIEECRRDILKL